MIFKYQICIKELWCGCYYTISKKPMLFYNGTIIIGVDTEGPTNYIFYFSINFCALIIVLKIVIISQDSFILQNHKFCENLCQFSCDRGKFLPIGYSQFLSSLKR